ncbi:MAG: riboflavin synthase [Opitutaceae bacterium]|nr:riboflavin synthase [Opitutaceae bacterium]
MFTGIVEETGKVVSFEKTDTAWKLRLAAKAALAGVARGDSIAVNGCCLTVVAFDAAGTAAAGTGTTAAAATAAGTVEFDVLEETRRLTSFSALKPGLAVNLERSLRFDGKVGGHFVTGHIDGLGKIEVLEPRGQDFYLRVRGPGGCGRHLVHKGSIAIDGISLTVAEVEGDTLAVWLIPTTMSVTNLREKRAGDPVNLEFDLLGKYVEKLLAARTPAA